MTKAEIKKITNEQLIVEYVKTYSHYDTNFVTQRGTDRLWKHLRDLESELLIRGILSEDSIKELNM